MKSKRGQAERVFLYIMTIVVVGLIILFGYKAIGNLLEVGATATKVQFQKDFQNSIAQGRSYGRITTHTFSVGDEYSHVCMIDKSAFRTDILSASRTVLNPLIRDSVQTGAPENAFLVLEDGTLEPYEVEDLEVNEGGLCVKVSSGKVRMRFEGKGNRVKVSVAPPIAP